MSVSCGLLKDAGCSAFTQCLLAVEIRYGHANFSFIYMYVMNESVLVCSVSWVCIVEKWGCSEEFALGGLIFLSGDWDVTKIIEGVQGFIEISRKLFLIGRRSESAVFAWYAWHGFEITFPWAFYVWKYSGSFRW